MILYNQSFGSHCASNKGLVLRPRQGPGDWGNELPAFSLGGLDKVACIKDNGSDETNREVGNKTLVRNRQLGNFLPPTSRQRFI